MNMFTFSSVPFSRAMEALEKGEMPNSNSLMEPASRVVVEDETQHPYAFDAYLVKTSDEKLKQSTSSKPEQSISSKPKQSISSKPKQSTTSSAPAER